MCEKLDDEMMKDLEELSDLHFDKEDYGLEINQDIVLEDSSNDSYPSHGHQEFASKGVLSADGPDRIPSAQLNSVLSEIDESVRQFSCSEEGFTSVTAAPPKPTEKLMPKKNRKMKEPKGFLRKIENDWKPLAPVGDFKVKNDDFPAL